VVAVSKGELCLHRDNTKVEPGRLVGETGDARKGIGVIMPMGK
jgi:hypothetical protein